MSNLHKPMKFVIVSDSFDDRSGGIVVLHLLAQRLIDAGQKAVIWPTDRPRLQSWRNPRRYLSWLRYHAMRRHRLFNKGPFMTRLARSRDLRDAVVVYPEVIAGNPLKAKNTVRWLLHRPGFHTGKAEFGKNELLFTYQDAFYDPRFGNYKENKLTITWWNSEYKRCNYEQRTGSCYLIKKGRNRPITHDLEGSVLIDSFSNIDKAANFNKKKYFYTYDLYTLYSRYAALCGCIPVIVPQDGVTREQWVPREEDRYGLAYGDEDIDWAIATRDLLLQQIDREKASEAAMVREFIDKCRAKFF